MTGGVNPRFLKKQKRDVIYGRSLRDGPTMTSRGGGRGVARSENVTSRDVGGGSAKIFSKDLRLIGVIFAEQMFICGSFCVTVRDVGGGSRPIFGVTSLLDHP